MAIRTLLDNDAVLVIGIDDASGPGHGGPRSGSRTPSHRREGWRRLAPPRAARRGSLLFRSRGVGWTGSGLASSCLRAGPEPFGEAMLVEVRSLPDAPGVTRTFGDKVLFRNDTVCVYEEILGPAQVRRMHATRPGSSSR